jgi:glutathione S-transferase
MATTDIPVIHQYQVSPFSAKVRRCLHYKEVAFEVVNYGLRGSGKIKKLNPRSKAPVLVHGSKIVPDSTDIIRYLESIYPRNPVIPTDPAQCAMAHVLEDWADESLYFYDLTMRCWPNNAALLAEDLLLEDKGLFKKLLRPLIPKLIGKQAHGQGIGRKENAAVCAEVGEHFKAINNLLEGRQWLVGDSLSVADIAVASMCTVLERAEEANSMMAALPDLMAWRERVDAATLPEGTPAKEKALV